jgi:hypothetical protein
LAAMGSLSECWIWASDLEAVICKGPSLSCCFKVLNCWSAAAICRVGCVTFPTCEWSPAPDPNLIRGICGPCRVDRSGPRRISGRAIAEV